MSENKEKILAISDLDIKDIEDLNWAFEELKDANKGIVFLILLLENFKLKMNLT